MAGHGSPPAEDKANDDNRKVGFLDKPRGQDQPWYHQGQSGMRPGSSIRQRAQTFREGWGF